MNTLIAAASEGVSHSDLITFFLSVALLIGVARILGEIAQKWGQPSILGELTAGLILGPSCLGQIAPELKEHVTGLQRPQPIQLRHTDKPGP